MKQPRAEAERWLTQAENDLSFAQLGAREGFPAQACFVCQQAAEKALKALHYWRGARVVVGHALVDLLDGLVAGHPALGTLRKAAQQLDQYYIPTRYPNGLPGGTPFEVFTQEQADEAIAFAREFIARARALIGGAR